MEKPVHVYNPDDEGDKQTFNGADFYIAPNSTLTIWPGGTPDKKARHLDGKYNVVLPGTRDNRWAEVTPEQVANHIAAHLGRWGVKIVSGWIIDGAPENPLVKLEQEEAEKVYLAATREWAHERVLEFSKRAKPFREADLPDPMKNEEEKKAHAWLDKNSKKLLALI